MNGRLVAFVGIFCIGILIVTSVSAEKPPKPPKTPGLTTEWIAFSGDLVGGEVVVGCCPNAGPSPEYVMTLSEDAFGVLAGTYPGYLFINNYRSGRNREYMVQFYYDDEVNFRITGGVIHNDKKNKILTVTFTDEDCYHQISEDIIASVTFTLVRTSHLPDGASAKAGKGPDKPSCTKIQEGTLLNSAGDVIPVGFDEWGYNYQARLFNGYYCDSYQNADWCQAWVDVGLAMKWNDAWLSNKDCDGDGLLDRHYGFDTYIGSGAWLTNHQSGEYLDDGNLCKWNYFVKIVAAPADAYMENGWWYTADGDLIGGVIWGEFAIIQQVENDSCAGVHGAQFVSPVGPGLGKF